MGAGNGRRGASRVGGVSSVFRGSRADTSGLAGAGLAGTTRGVIDGVRTWVVIVS